MQHSGKARQHSTTRQGSPSTTTPTAAARQWTLNATSISSRHRSCTTSLDEVRLLQAARYEHGETTATAHSEYARRLASSCRRHRRRRPPPRAAPSFCADRWAVSCWQVVNETADVAEQTLDRLYHQGQQIQHAAHGIEQVGHCGWAAFEHARAGHAGQPDAAAQPPHAPFPTHRLTRTCSIPGASSPS